MFRRNLPSLFRISSSSQVSSASKPVNEEKSKSFGRKAVSTALLCLTGGVALSAIDDLAIYQGCSRKAMEKASKNQQVINAIGEPVMKGPWYSASLSVAHKRGSASCTFPVSGPQGNGVLRLKAVRNGVLYVPGNEEAQKTVKISISDDVPSPACQTCPTPPGTGSPGKQ
ncbi:uncharacterized protein LOC104899392 isoform X2 [Beta vulgaris subsp. vulgaris]|uniref:uncharacterized protein LOC104899392 isoform X2 n=1 Tax=Beta vulgaris subsp. vulgaris TaxID=3555 RepID=UPI002036C283|nr:uncharacterized protein LOC104899392 isoform X2 [Beta vulgaris subsp. vulgaris]